MSSRPRKYIPDSFAKGGMLRLPKPMPLEHVEVFMISRLKEANVDPAVVYAFEVTALWVTKANVVTFSKREIAGWDRAVEFYEQKTKTDEP